MSAMKRRFIRSTINRIGALLFAIVGVGAIAAIDASIAGERMGGDESKMSVTTGNKSPVVDLPYAQGKSFGTLDEYLAHRKQLGAMDVPYFEARKDGSYVYIAGSIRRGPPEVYTREELLERFGFAE